jgi:hypothetical protein
MCEGIEAPPGFWGEMGTPMFLRTAFKCTHQVVKLISMVFASRASCISLMTTLPDRFDSLDNVYFKAAAASASFKHS